MPLKFYLDTNMAKQIAVQLKQRGVDVIHCDEVGMAAASDLEHLEYASREGRTLISFDKDFYALHAEWIEQGKSHTGVFCINEHLQGINGIGRIITQLFEYYELVEAGAATLEVDFHNQLHHIR